MSLRVTYLLGRFPVRTEYPVLAEIDALVKAGVDARILAFHAAPHPLPIEFSALCDRVIWLDPARQWGKVACGVAGLWTVVRTIFDRELYGACRGPMPPILAKQPPNAHGARPGSLRWWTTANGSQSKLDTKR